MLFRSSIRLSLSHLDTFRAQLRAILRASAGGNVRVLVPMVSAIDELRRVREVLDETQRELVERDEAFDPKVPLGVMIEVPSAAVIADALARECDFFSIGTNDLTQYTLAVDRGNERVAHLYDPLHPAVLNLVAHVIRSANRADVPVAVRAMKAGATDFIEKPYSDQALLDRVQVEPHVLVHQRVRPADNCSSSLPTT